MAQAEQIDTEAASGRNVQNVYIGKDGSRASRPQKDVAAIEKVFKSSGTKVTLKLEDLSDELLLQAAAFGLHQAGQNAYGGAGSEEERIEKCQDRWDTFAEGDWSTERQTGPRDSDVITAYGQVYKDVKGKDPTEDWFAQVRAKIAEGTLTTKGMQSNPKVKAKLDAIKAQRAAERAAKSAEAAGGDDSDLDFD